MRVHCTARKNLASVSKTFPSIISIDRNARNHLPFFINHRRSRGRLSQACSYCRPFFSPVNPVRWLNHALTGLLPLRHRTNADCGLRYLDSMIAQMQCRLLRSQARSFTLSRVLCRHGHLISSGVETSDCPFGVNFYFHFKFFRSCTTTLSDLRLRLSIGDFSMHPGYSRSNAP